MIGALLRVLEESCHGTLSLHGKEGVQLQHGLIGYTLINTLNSPTGSEHPAAQVPSQPFHSGQCQCIIGLQTASMCKYYYLLSVL